MAALKQMGENDLKELGIPMVCMCLFVLVLRIPTLVVFVYAV